MKLNSKDVEKNSKIKIDRWIDINSAEFKKTDKYPAFTKRTLELGLGSFLFTDELGRIWAKGTDCYYPFHDEYKGENIGYRIVAKALQ